MTLPFGRTRFRSAWSSRLMRKWKECKSGWSQENITGIHRIEHHWHPPYEESNRTLERLDQSAPKHRSSASPKDERRLLVELHIRLLRIPPVMPPPDSNGHSLRSASTAGKIRQRWLPPSRVRQLRGRHSDSTTTPAWPGGAARFRASAGPELDSTRWLTPGGQLDDLAAPRLERSRRERASW
jgi:hypothetical protein